MSLLVKYVQAFGRFQRNAQLYLLSNALSGVSAGILLVLYNLYLVSLGYRTDFIGLVLFSGTLGAGLAIFPAGLCIDRFGGKIVLIVMTLLFGVIGAGQILFRQPLLLLGSGFIAGVITAFFLVVNAPYLTMNSAIEERPQLFSLNIVVQLGTLVLGEVLGGAMPQWLRMLPWLMAPLPPQIHWLLAEKSLARSYQLSLLIAGLIAVPSLIPLFLLSDDRKRLHESASAHPSTKPSTTINKFIAIFCRGFNSLHPRNDQRQTGRNELKPLQLTYYVLASPFFALLLAWMLVGLGAGLFIPYFNVYFVQHLGASSALFGLIDGGANGINALLTLVAPLLALRFGKIKTVVCTRLISIPLLLTIAFTGILPLAALLYLFRQGAMDMSNGVFQVYSMEAVPMQRRGLANSGYQAALQVSWAVTTPLGGLLIAHVGYTPVFISGAVLYLLAIVLLWARFGRSSLSEDRDSTKG
ncbi:MAG: MFS transporter [Ktedonobacteraceae bacterium]